MTFNLCRAHIVAMVMLTNIVWRWLHLLDMDVVCGRPAVGGEKEVWAVSRSQRVWMSQAKHLSDVKEMEETSHLQPGNDVVDFMLTRGRHICSSSRTMCNRRDSINQKSINQNHAFFSQHINILCSVAYFFALHIHPPCGWRGDLNNNEKMLMESSSESCRQRWR